MCNRILIVIAVNHFFIDVKRIFHLFPFVYSIFLIFIAFPLNLPHALHAFRALNCHIVLFFGDFFAIFIFAFFALYFYCFYFFYCFYCQLFSFFNRLINISVSATLYVSIFMRVLHSLII